MNKPDKKPSKKPIEPTSKPTSPQQQIGITIAKLRAEKGWTQKDLAKKLRCSQPAVNRLEKGAKNLTITQVEKVSKALNRQIVSVNDAEIQSYRIEGGHRLSGEVTVNTSKNAAVALLCAALLNQGTTTFRNIARIEEVFRIIEVLTSIGVKCTWINDHKDLEIIPPSVLRMSDLDTVAARKTRSILMLMGPLLHQFTKFKLPYAGGCSLGKRSVEPHLRALAHFGLAIDTTNDGFYHAHVDRAKSNSSQSHRIVLIERGDTVTENILLAAARYPGETTIVGASPNYMVQDVCFFLQRLGVEIEGIGTTTLKVRGLPEIRTNVEYSPSEDPIEAMSFIAAALTTHSEITIRRAPVEFLEIELEVLKSMNAKITRSPEYTSNNDRTRLVDLQIKQSHLVAPADKIHPMPFPGLNIDNLPFFSAIAATAEGRTMIHDWVFENRAIYTTELTKLNAKVELLDAHRIYVEGPTNWRPAELVAPPALRPAVVVMLAMLAAPGTSILRNVYSINRGYQDFAHRLNALGAHISPLAGL